MKALVLLSGCGVFDGSEIHESVSTLICLSKNKIAYDCSSIDKNQLHVINHRSGIQTKQIRNILDESSRITRGKIKKLSEINTSVYSCLIIPGGFGVAKNLSSWALDEVECNVDSHVESTILHFYNQRKPIVSLCISPMILAKVLKNKASKLKLTIGSKTESSEYDIISLQMKLVQMSVDVKNCSTSQICIDEVNKIISAPCYMLNASVSEVYDNICMSIKELKNMLQKNPQI